MDYGDSFYSVYIYLSQWLFTSLTYLIQSISFDLFNPIHPIQSIFNPIQFALHKRVLSL